MKKNALCPMVFMVFYCIAIFNSILQQRIILWPCGTTDVSIYNANQANCVFHVSAYCIMPHMRVNDKITNDNLTSPYTPSMCKVPVSPEKMTKVYTVNHLNMA